MKKSGTYSYVGERTTETAATGRFTRSEVEIQNLDAKDMWKGGGKKNPFLLVNDQIKK